MPLSDSDASYDVVVIGGGPAGSTTATMLAKQGYSVLLLERSRFPRDHVGESLLPASMPVLDELGVLDDIKSIGFLPKWGATMVWGSNRTPWSWYFNETNHQYPHSYQVWRPEFDKLLLDNSGKHGVHILEQHRVLEVIFEESRAVGVKFSDSAGVVKTAYAKFVADASGQQTLLASQLKIKHWDDFFQNLAVYGYFSGVSNLPEPAENNIFIESYENGWIWDIPIHTGWNSIGVVADSVSSQKCLQQDGISDFLFGEISKSPHISKMLENAELESGPFVVKDWSYVCGPMVGDGYILVGDAACFVDPLFSSGVHLALMSGVLASAFIHTCNKDKSLGEACQSVYQEMYLKEYSHFRDLARLFYSSNRSVDSYFWEARRILESDTAMSPRNAFIQAVAGQSVRGYERVVLEHGNLPDSFSDSVNKLETERKARQQEFDSISMSIRSDQSCLKGLHPRLDEEVGLIRRPVLGNGEFNWGYLIRSQSRPEGVECSELVAVLVSKMDGQRGLDELFGIFESMSTSDQVESIRSDLLDSICLLYVDGVIAAL
jgi:flavin-dependent dehydrogenase